MKKHTTKLLAGCLAVSFFITTVFTSNIFAATSKTQSVVSGAVGSEQRLSGIDRYETAAKIAQEGWKGTSEYAVLSAGMDENLVDALAAAPLAKLKNAPILLTEGDKLNKYAGIELKRLGVKTVYVTTGDKVITKKILDQLAEMNITVVPLGGSDRYETSLNIAKQMGTFNKFVVATAWNNADALSIASIAAGKGMPILLSDINNVPNNVMAYIDSVKENVDQTYVLGGTGALTDNVKIVLPNAIRIGGLDRFGTNLEVLKTFANDLNYSKTYLANGEDNHLADALAGSPLAALTASPVVLTGTTLPSETKNFAKLNLGSNVITFGGEASIPSSIVEQLTSVVVYAQDGATIGSSDANQLEELTDSIKITAKNATLKNARTAYSVYIQGDNVVLDNVTITGTLFIDPGEKGTANINNVKAGKIIVLSGAKDSIHLKNTEAGTLVVSSSNEVRVESSGTTKIGNTVVTSYAILDAAGGSLGSVEVVTIAGQSPVVTFKGTFAEPIVVNGAATIKADANANIAKLEIAPENKEQKITLDGKFTTVEVNKEAQVDFSANTTVTNVVANVNAELNVPSGANIGTLDKKGNEVPVTGSGSVGGSTPSVGGGGSSGGVSTGNVGTKAGGFGVNGHGGVVGETVLTYTLGEDYNKGQIEFLLPNGIVAMEGDLVRIANAEGMGISSDTISDNGHKVTLTGVSAKKDDTVVLTLSRDIEIGRWDFKVIGDSDGNGPILQVQEPSITLYRPDFTEADATLSEYMHAGGHDTDAEFIAVTDAMDAVLAASRVRPWNQGNIDAANAALQNTVNLLKNAITHVKSMAEASLGEWKKDRTEPASWDQSNGWITTTTSAQQNSNSWYDWQGRGTATNVGLTDQWQVETQIELTDQLLNGTGVRTSMWVQVDGVNGVQSTQNNVLDWAILQFRNDPTTKTKGWESWDSTGDGNWIPLTQENVNVEKGIHTLKMVYDSGKISQYIDGILVREYTIKTDEGFDGVSAPSYVIIQSRTFGAQYTAKWRVPLVKYVAGYPAGTQFISTVDELKAAIKGQADGQTWVIGAGPFDIPRDTTTLRDSNGQVVTSSGQAGWCMPISANNLTIIGIGDPVLTSSDVTPNGSWASQNLITVWGDNVTIEGLTLTPKVDVNKTIEVVGDKKFTIRDCTFTPNSSSLADEGGSLYFNGAGTDGTKAILVENNLFNYASVALDGVKASNITIANNTWENIKGYAIGNTYWGSTDRKETPYTEVNVNGNNFNNVTDKTKIIAARLNQTFTLDAENKINGVAVNKDNFGKYINFNNLAYWSECKDNKVIVDGVTYVSPYQKIDEYVTNVAQLEEAISTATASERIIVAPGTYELSKELNITVPVTLEGMGDVTLKAANVPWSTENGSKHLLAIYAGTKEAPVTLSNLVIDADQKSHAVNTYNNAYAILNDVTIKNGLGAGLIVNGSTIVAKNLYTSGNEWGAVNVDPGSGVTTPSAFALSGDGVLAEPTQIWSDGAHVTASATVEIIAAGYTNYFITDKSVNIWSNQSLTNAAVITKNGQSQNFSTIQAAIAAADEGDIIYVTPGTYNGDIAVNKKVTLQGAADHQSIISGEIHLIAGSNGSTVDSFAINIGETGYGVNCDAGIGDVTVSDNIMNANTNGNTALAVYLNAGWGTANTVIGNTFTGKYSEGAVTVDVYPAPAVVVTTINGNNFSNVVGNYLKVFRSETGRLVTDITDTNKVSLN
ncbi:cell wall-binding repeat-containing protein [Desulfitobacterium metallireducens]|uniref:Cell wall-binding protein n=1 Tax=Desulfitobacterium metallireducens DSM 15288 TaxID=871968 RepID=W0EBA8_9FIRM|nr:cell wall-binding repeat-containing protein [Desulfitobacterium metallireducens]AHF08047.1 cell wall-binding protein [Desulfitobacterium metallireducens DSM 15288]